MLIRPPLHYADQPLHAILQRSADAHPERTGILFDGQRYTLRELDCASSAFARVLVRLGVGPGDRVAIIAPNRPEWVIAQLGASQAGAAVVMPNPSWKSELTHALELTRPRMVIADAATAAAMTVPEPAELRICFDSDAPPGWLDFWNLVADSPGTRLPPVVRDWGPVEVALPFSSGTTGLPKAVRHTHRSLVAAITQWKAASTIQYEDRLQLFLPLFHIYGLITIACAYWAGAPLTLFPRFDLETMLRGIETERVTIGFGVAPVAVAMANHPDLEAYDLSSIRYFLWGASPMIPEVAAAVTARTGIRWVPAYGTTEVPVLHVNLVDDPGRCRLDSPGLPVSDTKVKIVDIKTRRQLPAGETGEILVRSPSVMSGYLPDEANADAFEDEWFRTGDVGLVDEDGWLQITDRLKEMLKVNGFQVAPVELEKVLFSHPAVADCAVFGLADERTGEAPYAAVVLARPDVTPEELLSWVSQRLATYKHIRSITVVDEIPRTPSGKVLRRLLRDRHLDSGRPNDGRAV